MNYLKTPEDGLVASNPTIRLILDRLSVRRHYERRPVPRSVVEEIVRCGLAAPSSKNARPWRLHIVSNATVLREIADTAESSSEASSYVPRDPETGLPRPNWPSSVAESARVLRSVPTAIFVENLGVFSRGRETLASVPRSNLRGSLVAYTAEVIGIGAAVMNMWIAANSLDVQAVFMVDICIAEKEVATKLGFTCDLVGVLALGYSNRPAGGDRVRPSATDETRVVWHG